MMDRPARPRLRLPLTSGEWLLEGVALLLLLALFAVTYHYLPLLPPTIPTHFNGAGQADATGPKASYPSVAYIGLAMFSVLTLLEGFPHIYNYAVPITEENAARQYRLARNLLRVMKCLMLGIFTYLQWATAQVALHAMNGLSSTVMFVWLAALGVMLVGFVVLSMRGR